MSEEQIDVTPEDGVYQFNHNKIDEFLEKLR
ncbi:hypothetical protein ES708_17675 [subsurface metagenome]